MSDKLDSLISAALQKHDPEGFSPTMQDIITSSNYEKRGKERGLINEKTGSAVVVRENGQINMSAGHYAQYKINPSGKSIEQTLESSLITNRRRMTIDELVVNDHKFNPQLWELTDFKKLNLPTNEATIVGNLCVGGSVLTKSWDYNLKRYVLIRRPWRGPLFSNLLNVPAIKSALHIYDPLQVDDEIMANSDKGYHVNALISDAKSLIGQEGQDRDGIDRNFQMTFSNGATSSKTSPLGELGGGNVEPKVIFDALISKGYTEIAVCAILGNIQQESGFNTDNVNPKSGAYGLCQWLAGRKLALEEFAGSQGRPMTDAGLQIDFLMHELDYNGDFYNESKPAYLNQCTDVSSACRQFYDNFERGGEAQYGDRDTYANQFYEKFKNSSNNKKNKDNKDNKNNKKS